MEKPDLLITPFPITEASLKKKNVIYTRLKIKLHHRTYSSEYKQFETCTLCILQLCLNNYATS